MNYSFIYNRLQNEIDAQFLNFNEQNIGAYFQLDYLVKNRRCSLGLTTNAFFVKNQNTATKFDFLYNPYLSFFTTVKDFWTIQASYHFGMDRPFIDALFGVTHLGNQVYQIGNPLLRNAKHHRLNFNNVFWNSLSLSLDYTFNHDDIRQKITQQQDKRYISYENQDTHGLNLFANYSYRYKIWEMSYGGGLFAAVQKPADKNYFIFSPNYLLTTRHALELPLNFRWDISYMYLPEINNETAYFSRFSGFHQINTSLSKFFPKPKIQLSLSYNDIGGLSSRYEIVSLGAFRQTQRVNYYGSSILFRFQINIGQELISKTPKSMPNSRLNGGNNSMLPGL